MTDATDWRSRVGDVWAEEWQRTDRSLSDLARHLDAAILDAAPVVAAPPHSLAGHAVTGPASTGPQEQREWRAGQSECRDRPGMTGERCDPEQRATCPEGGDAAAAGTVLDIGCGAGATSLALAKARPDLAITGIDLSPALVAIAAARVPGGRFHVGDVARHRPGVAADLLVSRHGVMFFADPAAAFAHLRRHAAPAARLVFSCFAAASDNAFAGEIPAAVFGTAPMPDGGPGPFAFADRDRVAAILAAAGWRAAAAERVDFGYVAGAGDDPIADAVSFLSRIGPCARGLAAASPDERGRLSVRLADALVRYRERDRIVLPASAWLWRARSGQGVP